MRETSYKWPPDYSPVPKPLTGYQLLDESGVKELNYLRAMHKHFVDHLASQYRCGAAVETARLCAETLDPSGRLLGEVRDAARKS